MAEPVNTPMPPGTPVSATPRSTSPAPPLPSSSTHAPLSGTTSLSTSPTATWATTTTTPGGGSTAAGGGGGGGGGGRPVVLHLGDPIRHNPDTYAQLAAQCDVVRPAAAERGRAAFARALRERRWGDFAAVLRPSWGAGGEMGRWDADGLVALLPASCRVFANAGGSPGRLHDDDDDGNKVGDDDDDDDDDDDVGCYDCDVAALGARGVICCDGAPAAADAVADLAVALVVSVFRMLPRCAAAAASGDPARFAECRGPAAAAQCHNLRGRTLGIVAGGHGVRGFGGVVRQLATRCRHGFDMGVLYYDVEAAAGSEARMSSFGAAAATVAGLARPCASLEELCRASDCVLLCGAPAIGGGRGRSPPLIDAESLGWFRPGARLVNVGRGSLVDEDALAGALEDGRLAAAALDAHARAPRVHPRLAALADDRVLLTCQNAAATLDTMVAYEKLAMQNVMAVLGNEPPITPMNLQWLKRK